MRRGVWAVFCVVSFACGARTGLSGLRGQDAAVEDATIDVVHDAPTELDAGQEAEACCDLGVKMSGCQTCASGETCWNKVGACMHTVPSCGPSNCEGCCESYTACADGRVSGSCGTHGQMCQTCLDANDKYAACVPGSAGGTCVGGPTCTPHNCPGGCCNGDICMLGNVNMLCGNGGVVCADCTKASGYCDGGWCVLPHQ